MQVQLKRHVTDRDRVTPVKTLHYDESQGKVTINRYQKDSNEDGLSL